MKDRLVKLLEYYKISPAQLADNIGVQRSSISHILSERNKPSFDFLIRLLEKYPDLSADWLISGKGEMIIKQGMNTPIHPNFSDGDLFNQQDVLKNKDIGNKEVKNVSIKQNSVQNENINTNKINEFTNVNNVKQVILIYDDDTFRIIHKQ